jgi:drug/metabolite transporter (DMT)-like permease
MNNADIHTKQMMPSRSFCVFILVMALLMQSAIPVVFKVAAVHSGHLNFMRVLLNPLFVVGVLLFGTRLLLWQYLLRYFPLSFLHPFQSITLVLILVFSVLLFDETVTLPNMIGTAIIIVAVMLLSRSRRV